MKFKIFGYICQAEENPLEMEYEEIGVMEFKNKEDAFDFMMGAAEVPEEEITEFEAGFSNMICGIGYYFELMS